MKKLIMSIGVAMLVLVSCSGDDKASDPGDDGASVTSDNYPLAVGNVWYYTEYCDGVAQATPIVQRILATATLPNGTTVWNNSRSKLRYVRKESSAIQFYYDLSDNVADCSWPWPFAVGNQVINCNFDAVGEIRSGIFSGKETITVPAGTYDCFRLDWPDFSQWFAPGIGQVQYRELVGGIWVQELKLDSCSLN